MFVNHELGVANILLRQLPDVLRSRLRRIGLRSVAIHLHKAVNLAIYKTTLLGEANRDQRSMTAHPLDVQSEGRAEVAKAISNESPLV